MSDVFDAVERLVRDERLGAVATVVSGSELGAKAVIDAELGLVAGSLPDGVSDDVLADAKELMDREQSRTLTYDDGQVFIETVAPRPLMLVFGAGHVAQPLSRFARELGFRVVVADARATWATTDRFPDVDELVVGWPDVVLARVPLDRRTYVVLLSHDARFEDPVFARIGDVPVRYLGAMGSRRTHLARLERLRAMGWTEEQLESIHGPIGLDIGAETPAETAVSILAEIIQVRYGAGSGVSLRGTEGRIHRRRDELDATS